MRFCAPLSGLGRGQQAGRLTGAAAFLIGEFPGRARGYLVGAARLYRRGEFHAEDFVGHLVEAVVFELAGVRNGR